MRALFIAATALSMHACVHLHCDHEEESIVVSERIDIAPGYTAKRVLEGLDHPTQLSFDEDGRLFVLEGAGEEKSVRIFVRSSDGFTELARVPVRTDAESTGLLVLDRGRTLYVASRGLIERYTSSDDLSYREPEVVVRDLPEGWHWNNNLRLGPDQKIYFGMGSTCDVCDEADERSATILRFDPASGGVEIFARGLRNPYDLIFTAKGELLATDNGPDCCPTLGDDCPGPAPDRLLLVHEGDHFGWPNVYRGTPQIAPALLSLGDFAGAVGLAEYEGDIFVAFWGQQHHTPEGGRRVVRIKLSRDANETITGARMEHFLGPDGVGHPIALAVSPLDEKMYLLDYVGFVLELGPKR